MKKAFFLAIVISVITLVGTSVSCSKNATTTATTAFSTTMPSSSNPTSSALPGTSTSKPATSTTPAAPIKIGLIEDISGPFASAGIPRITGMKAAVQMINDTGGIKSLGGAKLTYALGTGDSTAPTSTSEIERLISSEKVVAVVGPTATAEILAAIPLGERYKIPLVTWLGDYTQFDKGYRYLFTLQPSMQTVGNNEANFMDLLAKKYGAPTDRLAICTLTPSYVSQSDSLVTRLGALGYRNVVLNESFTSTATDQTPLILKLKTANPSLVFYNGSATDGLAFLKASYTYDYYPWLVITSAAFGGADVRDALQPDVAKKVLLRPNVFAMGPTQTTDAYSTVPSLKAFQDAFRKANPNDKSDPAQLTVGALRVFALARAIENAKSTNPEDIANALRKLDMQAPDPYLVYEGQYPHLQMSDSGAVLTGSSTGSQWSDDLKTLQVIWPEDIANVKPRVQK